MTKRDDYFKALGRVHGLLGPVKGLGGMEALRLRTDLSTLANSASTALATLYEGLAELAQRAEEPAAVQPTVKALVLPPAGSKEEFALAAMAEAMGLKVSDVVVPNNEVKPEPAKKITNGDVKEAVVREFGDLGSVDMSIGGGSPVPVTPPEPSVEKELAPKPKPENSNVIISKKTGKPKRPYVRSGKFTDEAIKARQERWATMTEDERRAEYNKGNAKKRTYQARRMS